MKWKAWTLQQNECRHYKGLFSNKKETESVAHAPIQSHSEQILLQLCRLDRFDASGCCERRATNRTKESGLQISAGKLLVIIQCTQLDGAELKSLLAGSRNLRGQDIELVGGWINGDGDGRTKFECKAEKELDIDWMREILERLKKMGRKEKGVMIKVGNEGHIVWAERHKQSENRPKRKAKIAAYLVHQQINLHAKQDSTPMPGALVPGLSQHEAGRHQKPTNQEEWARQILVGDVVLKYLRGT
ncbi:hypothetical protein R3P38DRAFT_2778929 [Favolaschia claudopus]|uniref:Uncharacterized protein n=1 Tax=Favolaschia claudopus TaxID=2862362 RepID=A0AAW0BFK6_9AGAR